MGIGFYHGNGWEWEWEWFLWEWEGMGTEIVLPAHLYTKVKSEVKEK